MTLRKTLQYIKIIFGLSTDEKLGFNLMVPVGRYLTPKYKYTWPELDWFTQNDLTEILDRFDESNGFNAHRRLALQQLLRLTKDIPGDTAECGVYKGCGSYIILQFNRSVGGSRRHHIFDSFEGLNNPGEHDNDYWNRNDLAAGIEIVEKNLAQFSAFSLYKGWIPSRFPDVADRLFSFVHIDVDLYEPTLESIQFFYDRLSPGAILICDDYGFQTCVGATSAIDEFLAAKPEKMILLAGGGGFFIKGVTTTEA